MTKKDYILIAEVIKEGVSNDPTCKHQGFISDIVFNLCNELKIDNPLFNPERFTIACGLEYLE